mgnify:CR=1 FL=1
MQKVILSALGLATVLMPAVASAQSKPTSAYYITKEEVDTVNAQPGVDRTIQVMDIGNEHFSVGIIHRGKNAGPSATAAAPAAQAAPAPGTQACGTAEANVPAGLSSGLYHNRQTEGYLIVSGEGTIVTGGHIVNGRTSAPDAEVTTTLNGPSCSGRIAGADVVHRQVKTGDIVIIPAGVPHGWDAIPDHVDYLSFRPSQDVLTAGYRHPSLKK